MDSFDSGPGNNSSARLHGLRGKIRSNYAGGPKKCNIIALSKNRGELLGGWSTLACRKDHELVSSANTKRRETFMQQSWAEYGSCLVWFDIEMDNLPFFF